ncbi:uncharacterized protein LOC120076200 [Benincasa hispida]|uniref:uncharacterized protein LOC120076200 n=1 Tax=Benincasa hispida TaxID=102211 RepID=UPI0019012D11|nr:uncharacterized protein LOC120076200 [Benincasa hispida]
MEIIFNNSLVHYILLKEVEDDRKNVMTFDLNGTVITFTKKDFLLVIGLWQSPNPTIVRRGEAVGSLCSRYFKNDFVRDIHIVTLETMYKEMEFENDMDAMKMTLVYHTELGMMGREKTRTNVNSTLLIDVEDLDYFNSRNQGNVLWDRTLLELQRGLSDKAENYKKGPSTIRNTLSSTIYWGFFMHFR